MASRSRRTAQRCITRTLSVAPYSATRSAGDGSLGPKTPFAETAQGAPDGLVVSVDGAVWVAQPGGPGVGVYEPDGSLRELIDVGHPMCTSVCFGGEALSDLYIVSGSRGTGSDRGGAIFKVATAVAGLPVGPARIRLN